jgi:hypothetical protein
MKNVGARILHTYTYSHYLPLSARTYTPSKYKQGGLNTTSIGVSAPPRRSNGSRCELRSYDMASTISVPTDVTSG